MLLVVFVALGIVVLVALPNLRQGSGVLSPHGRRAVRRARQKPIAAVGGTWHGLVALKRLAVRLGRRIAVAWVPVSSGLHARLDRLEMRTRPGALEVDTNRTLPDVRPPAGSVEAERADVPRVTGRESVGRPRPMPVDSGPIPVITPEQVGLIRAQRAAAARARTGAATSTGRFVDLRPGDRTARERSQGAVDADQHQARAQSPAVHADQHQARAQSPADDADQHAAAAPARSAAVDADQDLDRDAAWDLARDAAQDTARGRAHRRRRDHAAAGAGGSARPRG